MPNNRFLRTFFGRLVAAFGSRVHQILVTDFGRAKNIGGNFRYIRTAMDEVEEELQTPDELFRTAVLFESALGAIAIALGLAFGPDARDFIPRLEDSPWQELAVGVGLGLVAAIPMWALISLVRMIPCEAVRKLEDLGDDGMFKILMKLSVPEMLAVCFAAGVGEELLFRGWLLPAVANWSGGMNDMQSVAIGVAVSSIAFGLVHPITKLYVVLASLIGFYLAGLMLWTDNLIVPIVAHAAYDAIQMLVSKLKPGTVSEKPDSRQNGVKSSG